MLKPKSSIRMFSPHQNITPWTAAAFGGGDGSSPRVCCNPNSEAGHEIEPTCREPSVVRARHSVRAAPATSACKISPGRLPDLLPIKTLIEFPVPTSDFRFNSWRTLATPDRSLARPSIKVNQA